MPKFDEEHYISPKAPKSTKKGDSTEGRFDAVKSGPMAEIYDPTNRSYIRVKNYAVAKRLAKALAKN